MRALVLLLVLGCRSATPVMPVVAAQPEIVDMVASGDGVVVRTRGGVLVGFDRMLRRRGELTPPSPASALARDGELLLVGLEDGAVGTVDPRASRWQLAPIGSTPGRVRWLGRHDGRLLAIVDVEQDYALVVVGGEPLVTIPIDHPKHDPSAFLLDGNTLWFGANGGEWGGRVGRIDLAASTLQQFAEDEARSPVYGFVKTGDGRVLRHGGLAHLGTLRSTIATVDERGVHALWRRTSFARKKQPPPQGPVTALIPTPTGYVAVVHRHVLETTADFATWTKRGELPARAEAAVALGDTIVIAVPDGLVTWARR